MNNQKRKTGLISCRIIPCQFFTRLQDYRHRLLITDYRQITIFFFIKKFPSNIKEELQKHLLDKHLEESLDKFLKEFLRIILK